MIINLVTKNCVYFIASDVEIVSLLNKCLQHSFFLSILMKCLLFYMASFSVFSPHRYRYSRRHDHSDSTHYRNSSSTYERNDNYSRDDSYYGQSQASSRYSSNTSRHHRRHHRKHTHEHRHRREGSSISSRVCNLSCSTFCSSSVAFTLRCRWLIKTFGVLQKGIFSLW